eukprot:TRINITY_DN46773_c0_g1_i1.p1 TRINITY_DN46773_c0_g1~~TRINITY_DN46773_c0_g1_i1.p1  ORF type:complete len:105 (+),score=31.38 TRINITY_DN46773_c0_g1_i1:63-377(+)
MVYTSTKVLRLPSYMARHWTTFKATPWPFFLACLAAECVWLSKYTTMPTDIKKGTYTSGYPESDPLAAHDQKYYAMLFRQQGVDITSPMFTGMSRETLQKQLEA